MVASELLRKCLGSHWGTSSGFPGYAPPHPAPATADQAGASSSIFYKS